MHIAISQTTKIKIFPTPKTLITYDAILISPKPASEIF
jgi:hypothetical protein